MDFIEHLQTWVKGETAQGRAMLVIGTLLLPAIVFIAKSDNGLLKGMLIPVCLLVVMNLGYGYVLMTRPKSAIQIESHFRQDPKQAVEKERSKAEAGDKGYYSTFKPVWVVMIVVSALLYVFLRNQYMEGLSLGLIGMFLGMLLIDTFLHDRLKIYLIALHNFRA